MSRLVIYEEEVSGCQVHALFYACISHAVCVRCCVTDSRQIKKEKERKKLENQSILVSKMLSPSHMRTHCADAGSMSYRLLQFGS